MRGRIGSDGLDRCCHDHGKDGHDLIEWINAQDLRIGKDVLFGNSAVGVHIALAAAERPPALDAKFLHEAISGVPAQVSFHIGYSRHEGAQGHRLAVMVAGSDFPPWDRNPKTGGSFLKLPLCGPLA